MITGADRIAANGDTANKIGTYGLAVLAHHHGIPFVIVAPTSTIDPRRATGAAIPIEERDGAEVTARFPARNPAFDVTPAALIAAIVTEAGRPSRPVRGVAARCRCARDDPGRARSRGPRASSSATASTPSAFERLGARSRDGTLNARSERRPRRRRAAAAVRPDASAGARGAGLRRGRRGRGRGASRAGRSRSSCSPAAWRRASAASSRRSRRRSTAEASSR